MSKREILFKAKRRDSGEWVEGLYVRISYGGGTLHAIADEDLFGNDHSEIGGYWEVEPSTLCQFADIFDKKGEKIFEGDIITACSYSFDEPIEDFTGEVVLGGRNGISLLALEEDRQGTYEDFVELSTIWGSYKIEYELVGNVYDVERVNGR